MTWKEIKMLNKNTKPKEHSLFQELFLAVVFLFLTNTMTQAETNQHLRSYPNIPEVISDVSDEELSEMRGRFIRQGRPIYFGISMQSQWSTAGGEIINAGMNIGINLRKDIATENMVTIDVNLDDAGQVPAEVISESNSNLGGLDSTQGVAQAISVAGDDNQAHNKTYMTLHFVSPELAAKSGEKVFYFGGKSLETSQNTTEITKPTTTSQVGKNGVVTSAFVDENGVGVKIEVPSQGTAMQLLRSKSDSREGSGLFQTVQVEGNANRVTNRLNFVAEFARTNGNAGNVRPALESLKAIQGLGIQ
jgi:hypothetical protein